MTTPRALSDEELEHKLKIALAAMLPEKIEHYSSKGFQFEIWKHNGNQIQDTEWLHVCWLVEQTLSGDEYTHFLLHLHKMTNSVRTTSATFEKRAQALATVKGVEV